MASIALVSRRVLARAASASSCASPLTSAAGAAAAGAGSSSALSSFSLLSSSSSSSPSRSISSQARLHPVRVKRNVSVILRQQIDTLGYEGQLVTVAPGYARNYLVPCKLAVYATQANLKAFRRDLSPEELRAKQEEMAKNRMRGRVDGVTLSFKRATSDGSALYGTVTRADLVEALLSTPLANLRLREANVRIGGEGEASSSSAGITKTGEHTVYIEPARSGFPGVWFPLRVSVEST